MSASIGAVWVLPTGATANRSHVQAMLGSWLDGARWQASATGGHWDLRGVADASLFIRSDDIGFDLLIVRFSSIAQADDPTGTLAWIESGFDAARGLGALFGLLTRYPDHFEPAWLREHVLIPVLLEEWDMLRAQTFEAVWVANAV